MSTITQYSGTNTFTPNFQASGSTIIEFSRNIADFRLNKYIGQRKVYQETGYYCVISPDEASRVVNINDGIWPDGQKAPAGNMNTSQHDLNNVFKTQRYTQPFTLGWLAVQ